MAATKTAPTLHYDALEYIFGKLSWFKEGSVGPPTRYLGVNIKKVQLADCARAWAISSDLYVHAAVANVEDKLKELTEMNLKTKVHTPIPVGYKPERYVSEELDTKLHSVYQQMIGASRWAYKLGHVDVLREVSLMSAYMVQPCEKHLEMMYSMVGYLKEHPESMMAMDLCEPVIDEYWFKVEDNWKVFYHEAEDELPPNVPKPLGKSVSINVFVDASYTNNVVERRNHT